MNVKVAARKTVFRRPSGGPTHAQAREPNSAPSVQVATITPWQELSASLAIHTAGTLHLYCAVCRFLFAGSMQRIDLRERFDPGLNAE